MRIYKHWLEQEEPRTIATIQLGLWEFSHLQEANYHENKKNDKNKKYCNCYFMHTVEFSQ